MGEDSEGATDREHTDTDAVRTRYDWSETTPSAAVAEVLAVAADRDPTETEPLYDSIDPDALDTLVAGGTGADGREPTTVTFESGGFRVTVTGDGEVVVR
ncbi:HalOD1 output domain-containing protein [Halosegnis marinus]|uniref:HalOD1 output domain-containing protein n=1 Tax=Halosegnis marinus TaxID=3034023 RepID=A0ABD5ZS64_9EURY|nr:HalOD1 output domain-containing protein [Halosegnis sp. DT85]